MKFRRKIPVTDLGGEWQFAYTTQQGPKQTIKTQADLSASGLNEYPCQVPGNFELDLQANGIIDEPFYGMNLTQLRQYETAQAYYVTKFTIEDHPGMEPWLVAEGLDYEAAIYINGKMLTPKAENSLIIHEWCIKDFSAGEAEIVVAVRPLKELNEIADYPPLLYHLGSNFELLRMRKAAHVGGWDIMPRALGAGIWRPIRVEYRPVERIKTVYLETRNISADHRNAEMLLHYDMKLNEPLAGDYEVSLEGKCGKSVFTAKARALFSAGKIMFSVKNPELWWVRGKGEQNLYDVTVAVSRKGKVLDQIEFKHGIRTIALDRTDLTDDAGTGEFCFRVNGEKIFVLGSNWVPADAFHSRDAERIPAILEMVDDIGCNMLRCWGGNVYENDLFYEICDQKGILVWQDFSMACGMYPLDAEFCKIFADEVRSVTRRLRQHPCIALWSGDNECDMFWMYNGLDPNQNKLTREVIPSVLLEETRGVPYLPSSPYVSPEAYKKGDRFIPEYHPWGPRDYWKGEYYTKILCHFASEIGYHGCPDPESIAKFISPEKLWPYQDNDEWMIHASNPVVGVDQYAYRIQLMANQIKEFLGIIPDNLDDFAFASQVCQAEAKKFFVEFFRTAKWRRTGLIWWNIMDGWPQFSDAVVDYYFKKKLAYSYIKTSQQPILVAIKEPDSWGQNVVVCNDTRQDVTLQCKIYDVDTNEVVFEGVIHSPADSAVECGRIPFTHGAQRFYAIEWTGDISGKNHYLAGHPKFELEQYRGWMKKAGLE